MGVAAAHPLAADAGLAVLRAGGSAVDAAVAVQAVLTLVEPQSSGIGGGAFLLHFDGQAVSAWDGRETAPAAAGDRAFVGADGEASPLSEAVFGGRAVGTPGVLRMLQAAHRQQGRRPWAELFAPAIALADNGFPIGQRLHTLLTDDPLLRRDPQARAYFYQADGSPHRVGHVLRNPALAAVLRAVAQQGADALHSGPIAQDMVARVRGHAVPGALSLADLAAYAPLQRTPQCADWRAWRVCGMGPPSSGHTVLMQVLGMLDATAPGLAPTVDVTLGVPGAQWLHAYAEASRLAWADRALYLADPAFVPAPAGDWASLLAPAYLQQRAALITGQRMATVQAGEPGGQRSAFAAMADQAEHGTSHLSIVDASGHAVAMTSSVESAFGARVMADGSSGLPGGYLLNNQLTDFSFLPTDAQGRPVANRLQPGKRPLSSMLPTLVFDRADGRLRMVVGSPGGPLAPHFVAKVILGTLAWDLDVQRAADLPNFVQLGGPVLLEPRRFADGTVQALRERGHSVVLLPMASGVHAIERKAGGWFGAADPRREGVVRGE